MKKLIQKAIPKLYGFYFNLLSLFSKEKSAALALKVFSIPRSGFITPSQQDFLDTARHQKVAFQEGFVQLYHWQGNGKTILLLHGWESNTARWKYLIEPLQEQGYNLIAIDAPAHGKTDGTEFTAIKYSWIISSIMELYRPEIMIAHSVGAMSTVFQEHQQPHDFLKKLVLLGSPNKLEDIMRGYQRLVGFRNKVYLQLDQLLDSTYGLTIDKFNTADFASSLTCKTLLIHSKQDAIVSYDSMQPIAAAIKNSQTYVSKTGGHSLHTPEVVKKVLKFVQD
jgi:pimeloyl-ACP methyl ester carboxylesterase